jgi:hypothetical protein
MDDLTILGFDFKGNTAGGMTENGELAIHGLNEKEQALLLYGANLTKYREFFSHFNCTSLMLSDYPEGYLFDLDLIPNKHRIKKLSLHLSFPAGFVSSELTNCFPNLRDLLIDSPYPASFPPPNVFPRLKLLQVKYEAESFQRWCHSPKLPDLKVDYFDERDLTALRGLTGLKRLRITRGKLRSLDGLEDLPSLRTLFAIQTRSLADVSALTRATQVQNIDFSLYSRTTDWSFLSKCPQLKNVSLHAADSVDFFTQLPNIQYFYCHKVADRGKKRFLFTSYDYALFPGEMRPEGIDPKHDAVADCFYGELP